MLVVSGVTKETRSTLLTIVFNLRYLMQFVLNIHYCLKGKLNFQWYTNVKVDPYHIDWHFKLLKIYTHLIYRFHTIPFSSLIDAIKTILMENHLSWICPNIKNKPGSNSIYKYKILNL